MSDPLRDACPHDEVLSPEFDAVIAQQAIVAGDLRHAAYHVAGALAYDPTRRDFIALLDAIVSSTGGNEPALMLFQIVDGAWFGTVAVHARLLAATDPGRALSLLCDVAQKKPEIAYLSWTLSWIDRLEPKQVLAALQPILTLSPQPEAAETFLAAGRLAQALAERVPEDPLLGALAVILICRVAEVDEMRRPTLLPEALDLALRLHARAHSWHTLVTLATTYRVAGRWTDAEACWSEALQMQPDDTSVRLDWADLRFERGDRLGAERMYEEVLVREPEQPWAIASLLYIRWLKQGGALNRLALTYYANKHSNNVRVRELADRATPWVALLPTPRESTITMLPRLRSNPKAAASTVTMDLSHLESPSSQLAIRRFLRIFGGDLVLRVAQVPTPDMRITRQHTRFPLWRWSGTTAQPAMPLPNDPRVITTITTIASQRYHSTLWLTRGAGIARQGGLRSTFEDIEQLLRTALHPPPGPKNIEPWLWDHRVVHAVALVLAGFPGWERSLHRDALLSMAAIRNDWLAEAALSAMTERALQEPAIRSEVQALLLAVLRDGPVEGYWCLGWPATSSLLRLGQEEDDLRHALSLHIQGFEPEGSEGTDA